MSVKTSMMCFVAIVIQLETMYQSVMLQERPIFFLVCVKVHENVYTHNLFANLTLKIIKVKSLVFFIYQLCFTIIKNTY